MILYVTYNSIRMYVHTKCELLLPYVAFLRMVRILRNKIKKILRRKVKKKEKKKLKQEKAINFYV